VLTETHGRVLLLTLNDPGTRNALGRPMVQQILDELQRFEADPALKVLVLTGADPAFCSGANVREFRAEIEAREAAGPPPPPRAWEQFDPSFASAATGRRNPLDNREIVYRLMASQKPSIAAVNGPATGLGHGLALCCDLRVASEKALFVESFPRMGIPPGDGSAWILPRLIGMGNTLHMQLTGEPVGAQAALAMGLCNEVTPHDRLIAASMELAGKIARWSSYSLALNKMLLRKSQHESFTEHLWEAQRALALARAGSAHKEGVRAFLEKREPQFD
jgi:enoyl-CoA hydratase/carnithine racemase